jgi:FkbM family methyltransferase
MKTFYSQQGEDFFLFMHYINQVRFDGVYVEVGAMDGLTYSNTKFLEDCLNFRGVLIEPVPVQFEKLSINRASNACLNYAISNNYGEIKFVGNDAMSGILNTLPDSHKLRYDLVNGQYIVNTAPLGDLLRKIGVSYIDFMSIDVEGGEQNVLESMNWEIPTYIICIELDGINPIKDYNCRNILLNKNFELLLKIGLNEFYINRKYERKAMLFSPFNASSPHIVSDAKFLFFEPHLFSSLTKMIIEYRDESF